MRREILTWNDVEKLIDHLIPQFETEFDAMVMITRGGIVPGGMLAEALGVSSILTAAVDFPAELDKQEKKERSLMMAWPKFIQFPESELLRRRNILVVDDVWGSGKTIPAVKNRITAADGNPFTCVLHFNPFRNLFGKNLPDYYGATTDAFIIYPWETNPGLQKGMLGRIH
jgi:hypoxanthine phosphoribosyltransferase